MSPRQRIHRAGVAFGCAVLLTTTGDAQTVAQWSTTMGVFQCELREDLVPITAGNFVDLTNARFYDGCIFHRVIDDFVIQDGDPTGTGEGGPGYTIPDEFHPDLTHNEPGILSMANAGPNTGGSQYFITLTPQPHLNGLHAVFGKVVVGIDVVQAIGDVPTDNADRPIVPVVIDSLRVLGIIYPHLELEQLTVREDPANSDGDAVINPMESGTVTMQVANWAGWLSAESIIGTMSCPDSRVLITQGTIDFGALADGDSTDNQDRPFRFDVVANEVFTTSLSIEIVANPNSPYPYSRVVVVQLPVTLNQPGWPQSVTSSSSPLIIDLDGDGTHEVVLGDQAGFVHAFKGDGQGELAGFPVSLGGSIRTSLAVGDIDADGGLDIAVTKRTPNAIIAIDQTGAVLFTHQIDEFLMANPIIADVDGAGGNEVIAVSMSTGSVIILSPDGSAWAGFPMALGATVRSSPAVGDLDRDGHLDVMVVSNAGGGSLHAISARDGAELPGWPVVIAAESAGGPMVTDLDGDGWAEVLVATDDGAVHAFNHGGDARFTAATGAAVKTSVVTGDLDGDDSLELVFVSNDGAVHVLDRDGNELPGFPVGAGGACQSTPVLADLNQNGTVDIVFGDASGCLHAVDITGVPMAPFPADIGAAILEGICVGDFGGAPDARIAAVAGTRLFLLDTKQSAGIVWPCFKGNPGRTGNTADMPTSAPDQDPAAGPMSFWLAPASPNPSPGVTRFRVGSPVKGPAALRIYGADGRLVSTLTEGMLEAGVHAFIWDGRDAAGDACPSGTYVCALSAPGGAAAQLVIRIR